jgi:predicted oxidoreductase (fatty acid repression mutant protein)
MSAANTMSFAITTQKRRSIRALQPISPIPDSSIIELASSAILHVPSAFNSQTTRLTILFSEAHRKLWSITASTFETHLGAERYNSGPADRIAGYMKGYGTILFWDDVEVVEQVRNGAPDVYKDKMGEWMHQSNGMHQYYLWVALEEQGLGVNVQHYNPLIDDEVKKVWGVSDSWRLRAQMVFGLPEKGTVVGEKEQKLAIEERLKVFGGEGES